MGTEWAGSNYLIGVDVNRGAVGMGLVPKQGDGHPLAEIGGTLETETSQGSLRQGQWEEV